MICKTTHKKTFRKGDLVEFDAIRVYGLVVDTKIADGFLPQEEIYDIRVRWLDGEEFWCLSFTLKPVNYL